jgi:hypothetical protein
LADMDSSSWLLVIELGSKRLLGDVSCLLALMLWFQNKRKISNWANEK